VKDGKSLFQPLFGLIHAFAFGHNSNDSDGFMDVAAMAAAVLSHQFHGNSLAQVD
jgi:hypothetical protein